MLTLKSNHKYMLVILWDGTNQKENHYFETEEEMDEYIRSYPTCSFDILYKFKLEAID